MTLRESVGADSERIHQLVDAVLDREDGVLILFDGSRVVTYAQGFGVSASQLELFGRGRTTLPPDRRDPLPPLAARQGTRPMRA